jgi:hypothetical protein
MFCEPNFKNRDMKEAIKKSVFFPNLTAPAGTAKSGHGAGEAGPYPMAGAKAKILFGDIALY